jgi:hypothetical protein
MFVCLVHRRTVGADHIEEKALFAIICTGRVRSEFVEHIAQSDWQRPFQNIFAGYLKRTIKHSAGLFAQILFDEKDKKYYILEHTEAF